MSGVYSGLQARIKDACPYAIFVPCAAHSLNLVGEYAASCCTLGTEFLNCLQS